MKLIIALFIVLTIVSCSKKDKQTITLYPEGFFSFKSELYFSDGKAFYCTFRNWEHLYELRGTRDKPKSEIIIQDELPKDMRFVKFCNSGILTPKFYQ